MHINLIIYHDNDDNYNKLYNSDDNDDNNEMMMDSDHAIWVA